MKHRLVIFLALVLVMGIAPGRPAKAATRTPILAAGRAARLAENDQERPDTGEENRRPTTPTVIPTVPVAPTTTSSPEQVTPTTTVPASSDTVLPTSSPTTTVAPNISTNFPWAWIVTRTSGIASFLLLTLLSITGILLTTGALFRLFSPATAWSIHRAIASTLLFSVVTHVVSLLVDRFINLRLVDVFIPFVSPFRTLYVALGIFGFYLLLLVLSTSLYTMTSHARFWRTVHWFAFPMFLLIFLHGVLIGSDTKLWWMHIIYWGAGIAVGLAVLYRMIWKYRQPAVRPPRDSYTPSAKG